MSKFQDLIEKAMRGEPLDEVAPPGDKYERMVKHIKSNKPKGRSSDKQKEIAYATAWKNYNKENESVGETVGGPEYDRILRMARVYLDTGMSADGVRQEAEQQQRSGFDDAARFGLAVAHAMDEMENPAESKGGGHTTQVPLRDMKGGGAPVTAGNLSGTTEYPSDHQLAGGPMVTDEETGTNVTRSGPGTGVPHSPWVATDALPLSHTYDMDIGKLPESFDFNLNEVDSLASEKGIKRVRQDGDLGGKDVKFSPEPEGKRPDYKKLGAKDVKDADNLSDEAINSEMKNSAYENIRIDHATKGRGTVVKITDKHLVVEWDRVTLRILGPERLPLSETKYIIRIKENYADDPSDIDVDKDTDEPKGKKKMAKKQKVDEAMVAIQPTMRMSGDGYKLPVIDLSPEDIGLINEIEVPDPGDSVLTGQDQQKASQVAPLSTERGADAAHDDIYPDGDFGKDLVPGDAPSTPGYEQMGDEAGNPRATDGTDNPAADVSGNSSGNSSGGSDYIKSEKSGGDSGGDSGGFQKAKKGENPFAKKDSDDSDDSSDSDDSDDSEKKDDEDKDMKESKGLTWKDIGLDVEEVIGEMADAYEMEACEGCGDEMMGETHDAAGGEVAFTPELLKNLMSAVRDQSPDDDKLQRMCDALKDASAEKGQTLDDGDMGSIMDKYKNGGGVEADASPEMGDPGMEDPNSVGGPDAYEGEGEDNEAGDVRRKGHGSGGDDDAGVRDDEYGDEAEDDNDDDEDRKYQEQDRAEGDGEEAGPEGGDEHEGKTKLMDKKGREEDDDEWGKASDHSEKQKKQKRRGDRKEKSGRKYTSMENKGKKNIKPVSSNTSKGKGPGGGNATNDGQGMLIPAMDKGSQRGTPGTPLSKEGGGRTVKPVSESMVAVGMAGIGHTARDLERHSMDDDGLTEDEKELREIKKRAGLPNWWK